MHKKQETCCYTINYSIEECLKKYNLNNIKVKKVFHYEDLSKNEPANITLDIEYDSQQPDKRHWITLIYFVNKSGNITGYGYDLHEKTIKPIFNFNEKFNCEKHFEQAINHKNFITKQQSS